MRRVAITGVGAVTPLGNDAESTWQGLAAGRSGIGPLTVFDSSTFPVRIAGEVKDFDLGDHVPSAAVRRRLSRAGGFGLAASLMAVASARLREDSYEPEERGVSIGAHAARPELQDLADILSVMHDSEGSQLRPQAPRTVVRSAQNTSLALIALLSGCRGPMISLSTACAGSCHAIGEAYRRIQEGDARMMVAGGHDSLTTYLDVLGFALLGALTTEHNDDPQHASRPFDRDRSGFVIGEGAVVVVLEEWSAAAARGAPILGEITGYGSSMNAYRITDSPPDGGGAILAMSNALADAAAPPTAVDYVVAHGTSTPGNDLSETVAVKEVFGDHAYRLAISSPKSMTGHLTSAAASLNLLAALGAMRDGVVPPTLNLEHPDPKLDLDYVPNHPRPMRVRTAIVNAFAFGGTNASLLVTSPN